MKVLLINQNATIDRLVTLSTGKLLFELTKATDLAESAHGEYDFVIIDSDVFEEDAFASFKDGCGQATFLMILSKGFTKPSGFDVFIEKPFLPTELVDILSTTRSTAPSFAAPNFEKSFSPSIRDDDEIPSLDDLELTDEPTPDTLDLGEMMTLDDAELEEPSFGADEEIVLDDLGDFDEDEIKLDDMQLGDSTPILADDGDDALDKDLGDDDLDLDGLDFGDADTAQSVDKEPIVEGEEDAFSLDELKLDEMDAELSTPLGDEEEVELDGFEGLSLDIDDVDKNDALMDPTSEIADEEIPLEIGDDMNDEDDLLGSLDELNEDLQSSEADGDVSFSFEDHEKENGAEDEEEEEIKVPSSIFGDDEVRKLKEMLDEADSEEKGFDPSEVKVQNDELGSLTEESLAEALGIELDDASSDSDFSEIGLENLELPSASVKPKEPEATGVTEMSAADFFSIPLDKLKMLLDTADITVNITLSKKK
jgi:uncharacterized membrane protein